MREHTNTYKQKANRKYQNNDLNESMISLNVDVPLFTGTEIRTQCKKANNNIGKKKNNKKMYEKNNEQ